MNLDRILQLARKHVVKSNNSSARVHLSRAIEARDYGLYYFSMDLARLSLLHSVGTKHRDYKRANGPAKTRFMVRGYSIRLALFIIKCKNRANVPKWAVCTMRKLITRLLDRS